MLKSEKPIDILPGMIREQLLILDGAMGSMIQRLKLDEAAVRGPRFAGHNKDLVRFSDILNITNPDAITDIHYAYLEAGADIVETNSFGA
ncbi:MAG: homocysteine S-methyltransferase family protein, partial [Pirellulaceae bacterium]